MSSEGAATQALFLAVYEEIRRQQEAFNGLFIEHWAIVDTLIGGDEARAESYLANLERLKAGEMGQVLASRLQQMDEVIEQMKKTHRG